MHLKIHLAILHLKMFYCVLYIIMRPSYSRYYGLARPFMRPSVRLSRTGS